MRDIDELINNLSDPSYFDNMALVSSKDIEDIIKILQTYKELTTDTHEPLTWEQLQYKVGEPVWVQGENVSKWGWKIVGNFWDSGVAGELCRFADADDTRSYSRKLMGIKWSAYERPQRGQRAKLNIYDE